MGLFQSKFEISCGTSPFAGFTDGGSPVVSAVDPLVALDQCTKAMLPTDWVGLPNRVELTRGHKPGRAYILLTYKDMKTLGLADLSKQLATIRITCQMDPNGPKDAFTAPKDSISGSSPNYDFNPIKSLDFSALLFVQAVAIVMNDGMDQAASPSDSSFPNAPSTLSNDGDIYLCEFADRRVLRGVTSVYYSSTNVIKAASQSDVDSNLDPDDSFKYEDCSNVIRINGSAEAGDASNFGYPFEVVQNLAHTVEGLRYEAMSTYDVMAHMLSVKGFVQGGDFSGGTPTINRGASSGSTGADRSYTDYRTLIDNAKIPRYTVSRTIQGTIVSIPSQVTIHFPMLGFPCGTSQCTNLFYPIAINTSDIKSGIYTPTFGITTSGGNPALEPGMTSLVDYSLHAVFDFSAQGSGGGAGTGGFASDPTNLSDLQTRATERATEFINAIYRPTNTSDILHGLWVVTPSNDVQKVWFYDFGKGTYTQLFYGDDDLQEPYPRINYYSSPREFRSDPNSDRYLYKQNQFKGMTQSRLRVFDAYIDDGSGSAAGSHSGVGSNSPALVIAVEKEVVINGDVMGVCRMPDIVFQGSTCQGSGSGS